MASFDIVSKAEMHEVDNAVGSVVREITQRYDFKGKNCTVERDDEEITLLASDDTAHKAMVDLLKVHFTRRKIDPRALDFETPEQASGNMIRQKVTVKQGVSQEIAKQITKGIKGSKLKVQAAIRGDELRITGKKRDDLQEAISYVKEMNLDLPLQFINFRD